MFVFHSLFRSGVVLTLKTIVMPVSTRSKAKAGKRGAKTTRDSASKKKAKRLEDGYTAAERCANPLIRDLSLQGLTPFKLSELRSVLGLREFYKLFSGRGPEGMLLRGCVWVPKGRVCGRIRGSVVVASILPTRST